MTFQTENEGLAMVLCSHLRTMVYWLRQMKAEDWDWRPDVAAPTARILATHAYQWLICDRYHISEPDALKHPDVPDLPTDPTAACDALADEIQRWQEMIMALTPEQLLEPRMQFTDGPMNVRGFLYHIAQNCIYKNGQFATLYFALGYDGKDPYDAPFPNPIYADLRAGTLLPDA